MNRSQWFRDQLQASGAGFVWGAEQMPPNRRNVRLPHGLGKWTAARFEPTRFRQKQYQEQTRRRLKHIVGLILLNYSRHRQAHRIRDNGSETTGSVSMRLRQLTWLRPLGISVVVLAFLLLSGMMMAQEAVTVQLDPMSESGVSGTATLIAAGDGTSVAIDVKGLAPGANARATMQANTCAMPSTSFAALPDLKADATGRATATGSVLFHGTGVALATMADGEHIIAIHAGGQIVACGVIPRPTSASAPPTLPVTGGVASWFVAAAAVLGFCALSVGLFLRRRSRPRRRF